jgi:hypothetical protein
MTTNSKLGIWMDHASAHLIEFEAIPTDTTTNIASEFTYEDKVESLSKSESQMHHKEQHEQATYYKKIGEKILNYKEVFLFGPTEAKTELFNILKADHHFDKITFHIKQTDKLPLHQQRIFMRKYFSKF